MAVTTVAPRSSHTQFSATSHLDTREIAQESFALAHGCSLHMALIQQSVRRWEKPWRHQRAIVLFANSPEQAKLRIKLEWGIRAGEQIFQIIPVAE